MKQLILALLLLAAGTLVAQSISPTPGTARLESFQSRQSVQENNPLSQVPFESIGPTVMSGRVTSIAVNPDDPTVFYVAYASGGVWKTINNGLSFQPVFDHEATLTIGTIAVDWKNNETVWVGTGEVNSSRSSYAGTGIYKSGPDSSWTWMGLPESHHIGRIVLHPKDPKTIWVAVLGHLYTDNAERGVYKSTDGGKSWNQVLAIDRKTGVVDLVMEPGNPEVLYAAAWQRDRKAWNFMESGPGSGIYKSEDGGSNWTNLTDKKSGFPTGEGTGRIGLAVSAANPNRIYAFLDNQFRRDVDSGEKGDVLTKADLRAMSTDDFLKIEPEELDRYLSENGFPKKYKAAAILEQVKKGELKPVALVEYLEDANRLLFDTPVKGAEVYVSNNGGKRWEKTHEAYIDDLYYSYGYYFGGIGVDPQDADRIYIMGVPILTSADGGKTFSSISADNVHADHHALWVNPAKSGHLICGNDGGINISYDDGQHWFKANSPAVGQFYTVAVDNAKPFQVYGGLQDNGVWNGPSNYKANTAWHSTGKYPYRFLLGGDGMQVAIDSRDNETIYTGSQFGYYYRLNKSTGSNAFIRPVHELGERPYRFNWQTPIHLSIHNQDILYLGANKLFRSMNQGDDWTAISEDLTKGGIKGDVPFGTLATIHESTFQFGLLYVGSDDGLVHVSKDGGNSWQNISKGLPEGFWVTRVRASSHEKGRVYVSLNGYRSDNFDALIFMSDDFGESWTRIGTLLPAEPVNDILEDPANENLLYVGTDAGMYVSLDRGKQFYPMMKGLPHVAVHALAVQARDKVLVIGTHGRSLYRADIGSIQQLSEDIMAQGLHFFPVEDIRWSGQWGKSWSKWFDSPTPSRELVLWVAKQSGQAKLRIETESGLVLKSWEVAVQPGLNYLSYDLTFDALKKPAYEEWLNSQQKEDERAIVLKASDADKWYLRPGKYTVILSLGQLEAVKSTLKIK